MLGEDRGQHAQPPAGRPRVPVVAGQGGEAEQPVAGERVRGRRRAVLDVLRAHDERRRVGAGAEEAAPLGVGEAGQQAVGGAARLGEPGRVVDLGQAAQRLEQRRVVLREPEPARVVTLPAVQEPPVGASQRAEQEPGRVAGGVEPVGPVERPRGLGQGAEEQRVPAEQDLVVEARSDPPGSNLEQPRHDPVDRGRPGLGAVDRVQDVAPVAGVGVLEVPGPGDPEVADHLRRVVARDRLAPRRATRDRTCPRRPPSRRPRPRTSRRRRGAGRAARRRRGPRRPAGSGARRSPASPSCTRRGAAPGRTASSRSGAPASGRPPSSGGSRRRPGRTSRRPPSRRASP